MYTPIKCWRVKFLSEKSRAWYFHEGFLATELEAQQHIQWIRQRYIAAKYPAPTDYKIVEVYTKLGATHRYPITAPIKLTPKERRKAAGK